MVNWCNYDHGDLFGVVLSFPKRGDGLSMHTHDEETRHNVILLKGSVEVYGPEKRWSRVLKPGDVMDFTDEQYPHEIAALEDETVILNMNLHGRPSYYTPNVVPEDGYGTYDNKPLTIPLE
jgi:quercetin dioxygenase-like cupin family protein